MNQYLLESDTIRTDFVVDLVPLRFAASVGDIGTVRAAKVGVLVRVWSAILKRCLYSRPSLAYLTIAPSGLAFWRDLTFVGLLKAFRVPIVFHIHGRGLGESVAGRLQRSCSRWAFSDATVVQLSPRLYQEIADIVPLELSRIVPNGIPDLFWQQKRTDTSQTDHALRILFLSNMVPEKGIFELLEAVSMLLERGLPVEGTFVGPFLSDVVKERFLAMVGAFPADAQVRWVGAVFGEDRRAYLERADVFAFPSYYGAEAFPLAVLEAMSASLPVIACETGAVPDIVEHGVTGFVVPVKSPRALADAIETLIRDRMLRAEMGLAGRQRYEREFRIEKFLARMHEVLTESAGIVTRGSAATVAIEDASAGKAKLQAGAVRSRR